MMDWSWPHETEITNETEDPREREFHNWIRDYIVLLLILFIIYCVSHLLIVYYRRNREEYYADDDDRVVYRISSWMCTFSLAISIGAALLLPFSILTNEILIIYPDNYYMQWLNDGLVGRLWDSVFLFSNLSLFVLLPFAYFFTESEGFSGSKTGIMARVNETVTLLVLLIVLVLGMTYLLCLFLRYDQLGLLNLVLVWNYLPFLYSCVSFVGVLLLLVCTPVGIASLFDVLGNFLVKPFFWRNIQEEYDYEVMREMHLRRTIEKYLKSSCKSPISISLSSRFSTPSRSSSMPSLDNFFNCDFIASKQNSRLHTNGSVDSKSESLDELQRQFEETKSKRLSLESQKRTSRLRRNLVSRLQGQRFLRLLTLLSSQGYPLALLALVCLTVISALVVIQNTLELLVGIKALPVSSAQQIPLGISSRSMLGLVGSSFEVVLIMYLWCASVAGFYSLPLISRLTPRAKETSFTQIIGNCALLLVLSSALPVLSRLLGITNFDLLGEFGRIEWLGNFYIVLIYNLFFVISTAFSLAIKFTDTVRREIFKRLRKFFSSNLPLHTSNRRSTSFSSDYSPSTSFNSKGNISSLRCISPTSSFTHSKEE